MICYDMIYYTISHSLYTYIYIYIYIYMPCASRSGGGGSQRQPGEDHEVARLVRRSPGSLLRRAGAGAGWARVSQSCISKGIWRQGIGSFVRNSYVSTLCPVVICPDLCTSESAAHGGAARGAGGARAARSWSPQPSRRGWASACRGRRAGKLTCIRQILAHRIRGASFAKLTWANCLDVYAGQRTNGAYFGRFGRPSSAKRRWL